MDGGDGMGQASWMVEASTEWQTGHFGVEGERLVLRKMFAQRSYSIPLGQIEDVAAVAVKHLRPPEAIHHGMKMVVAGQAVFLSCPQRAFRDWLVWTLAGAAGHARSPSYSRSPGRSGDVPPAFPACLLPRSSPALAERPGHHTRLKASVARDRPQPRKQAAVPPPDLPTREQQPSTRSQGSVLSDPSDRPRPCMASGVVPPPPSSRQESARSASMRSLKSASSTGWGLPRAPTRREPLARAYSIGTLGSMTGDSYAVSPPTCLLDTSTSRQNVRFDDMLSEPHAATPEPPSLEPCEDAEAAPEAGRYYNIAARFHIEAAVVGGALAAVCATQRLGVYSFSGWNARHPAPESPMPIEMPYVGWGAPTHTALEAMEEARTPPPAYSALAALAMHGSPARSADSSPRVMQVRIASPAGSLAAMRFALKPEADDEAHPSPGAPPPRSGSLDSAAFSELGGVWGYGGGASPAPGGPKSPATTLLEELEGLGYSDIGNYDIRLDGIAAPVAPASPVRVHPMYLQSAEAVPGEDAPATDAPASRLVTAAATPPATPHMATTSFASTCTGEETILSLPPPGAVEAATPRDELPPAAESSPQLDAIESSADNDAEVLPPGPAVQPPAPCSMAMVVFPGTAQYRSAVPRIAQMQTNAIAEKAPHVALMYIATHMASRGECGASPYVACLGRASPLRRRGAVERLLAVQQQRAGGGSGGWAGGGGKGYADCLFAAAVQGAPRRQYMACLLSAGSQSALQALAANAASREKIPPSDSAASPARRDEFADTYPFLACAVERASSAWLLALGLVGKSAPAEGSASSWQGAFASESEGAAKEEPEGGEAEEAVAEEVKEEDGTETGAEDVAAAPAEDLVPGARDAADEEAEGAAGVEGSAKGRGSEEECSDRE